MHITLKNNHIAISFTYNERLVACMRNLPSRKYDPRTKAWYIPVQSAYESVRLLESKGFSVSGEARQALEDSEAIRKRADELRTAKDTEFATSLPLYPFQKVVASFMVETGSCLNACGVGTGKSLQFIASSVKLNRARHLIVCPKSLMFYWREEILKWLPDANVIIAKGNKNERLKLYKNVDKMSKFYFIINYDLIRIDVDDIINI